MQPLTFPDLPDWRFTVEEVSIGCYRVTGVHADGRLVGADGADPGQVLNTCRAMAGGLSRPRQARPVLSGSIGVGPGASLATSDGSSAVRRRRKLFALVIAAVGVGVAVLAGVWWTERRAAERHAQIDRAMADLLGKRLGVGYHGAVPLPPGCSGLSVGGAVEIVIDDTGRTVVLFKESVGWKGNYRGLLISDQPFRPSDFAPDAYGRTMMRFPDLGDPVVERKVGPCEIAVMFDLG